MTGFGRAERAAAGWRCRVEIRSVNNRFLESRIRLPTGLGYYEDALRDMIKSRCVRGKIDCSIAVLPEQEQTQQFELNVPLARGYAGLVDEVRSTFGQDVTITLHDLLEIKDLVAAKSWEPRPIEDLLSDCLGSALEGLVAMRAAEGQATLKDLQMCIAQARSLQEQIQPLSATQPQLYAARLRENIYRINEGRVPIEDRILQEVAMYVERCDIAEEIARFAAHLDAGENMLATGGAIGRKFEFLLQELNREANTLAAKSNHSEISALVIEMKGLLEKMREQIQNIE